MIYSTFRIIASLLFLSLLTACTTSQTQPDSGTGRWPVSLQEFNAALPPDVDPESRGRLPIVDREQLDDKGKATYDGYSAPDSTSLAGIQGPGGVRLHAIADKSPSRIDGKMRELIRLVMAREMDQQFEWTMHEPVAIKEGLDPAIIETIRHSRSLQGTPEPEAAIIQLGREIVQQHRVSSETYSRLANYFGKKDLIQITELIGGGMNSFVILYMFDVHLPYDRKPLLPID